MHEYLIGETLDHAVEDEEERGLEKYRQAAADRVGALLAVQLIISSFKSARFSAPLYFCCSFLISGCSLCIAIIDFVLLIVNGVAHP